MTIFLNLSTLQIFLLSAVFVGIISIVIMIILKISQTKKLEEKKHAARKAYLNSDEYTMCNTAFASNRKTYQSSRSFTQSSNFNNSHSSNNDSSNFLLSAATLNSINDTTINNYTTGDSSSSYDSSCSSSSCSSSSSSD